MLRRYTGVNDHFLHLLRELFVGPRFGRDVKNGDAVRLAREGFVQPIAPIGDEA